MLIDFPTQAVILVGGKGTRLKKVIKNTAKPLVKLDNIPFLEYQINYLSQFPFQEIILLCGYKYPLFLKFIKRLKNKKVKFKIINEQKVLGTGGSIINAKKKLNEVFFLCNGDTFFEINLLKLFQNMKKNNSDGCIALKKSYNNNRYNKVVVHNKKISEFTDENVKKNQLYNTGYYFLNKKFFNGNILYKSLEKDILPKICKNYKISYKVFSENLIDIGIPEDLNLAKKFFINYNKRKFVILDRDGVINKELKYVHDWKNFILIPGILKLLKLLNEKKIPIFVVTNQAGVAKGLYKPVDVENLHSKFEAFLLTKNIFLNQIYKCFHHQDAKIKKFRKNCSFRKPKNSYYKLIKKSWRLKSNNAIFVDDKIENQVFAHQSNIKFVNFDYDKHRNICKYLILKCKKFLL